MHRTGLDRAGEGRGVLNGWLVLMHGYSQQGVIGGREVREGVLGLPGNIILMPSQTLSLGSAPPLPNTHIL